MSGLEGKFAQYGRSAEERVMVKRRPYLVDAPDSNPVRGIDLLKRKNEDQKIKAMPPQVKAAVKTTSHTGSTQPVTNRQPELAHSKQSPNDE